MDLQKIIENLSMILNSELWEIYGVSVLLGFAADKNVKLVLHKLSIFDSNI